MRAAVARERAAAGRRRRRSRGSRSQGSKTCPSCMQCSSRAAVAVHPLVTVPTVARTAAARRTAHARCIGLHQQEERGREGGATHRSPATAHRGTHAGSAHVRAPRMAGPCGCAAGSPLKTGGPAPNGTRAGERGGPRAGLESACACRRRGGGPASRPQPCGARTEGDSDGVPAAGFLFGALAATVRQIARYRARRIRQSTPNSSVDTKIE